VEEGDEFFAEHWPEARAVSDPGRDLYRAFGLLEGGLKEIFAPEVLACGLRSASRGHLPGKVVGDVKQMPGFFVVKGNRIVRSHRSRHIADHPDYAGFAG
jgi:hypothetical protein